MKKHIVVTLLAVTGGLSVLWAGAVISEFRAEPGRNKVTLKWTSEAEINLKGFEVQRGRDEKHYDKIDFVNAKGSTIGKTEYTYEDNSVFKTASRTYYYRLKIMDKNGGFTYSKSISVNPTISSARATWGSIKAMFR